MRKSRIWLWAVLAAAHNGAAQAPLSIDLGFQANIPSQNVYSILPLPEGKVIISGHLNLPGLQYERSGARLLSNGQLDPSFSTTLPMGAKLTAFGDKYYSGNGGIVRRFHMHGAIDNTFNMVGAWPQFMAGQGGDYHVFPDGRVLMGGYHSLNIPSQGILGDYNLIWFTSAGQVDTTRVHRTGNGTTWRLKQYPEGTANGLGGKFLVYHFGSIYEGQPVSKVIRIHADGSLDPSFVAPVIGGWIGFIDALPDGRAYLGGMFQLQGQAGTSQLVRLLPDGSLDPTFNNNLDFYKAPETVGATALVSSVLPVGDGLLAITGAFNRVDDRERDGICILDTLGIVVDHYLQGAGCGPYDYYEFGNYIDTYAEISGMVRAPNGQYYIWGAYHGYSDGTTTDTLQRMITRLHGGEIGLGVAEQQKPAARMRLYPNPASTHLTLEMEEVPRNAELVLRDALGREVFRRRLMGYATTVALHGLAEGAYMVEAQQGGKRLLPAERLVIGR